MLNSHITIYSKKLITIFHNILNKIFNNLCSFATIVGLKLETTLPQFWKVFDWTIIHCIVLITRVVGRLNKIITRWQKNFFRKNEILSLFIFLIEIFFIQNLNSKVFDFFIITYGFTNSYKLNSIIINWIEFLGIVVHSNFYVFGIEIVTIRIWKS